MDTPRELLTKLRRTIEAKPAPTPPPPQEGWLSNEADAKPSDKDQKLEGARVLSQLYEQRDQAKREGREPGPIAGYHVTGWGG